MKTSFVSIVAAQLLSAYCLMAAPANGSGLAGAGVDPLVTVERVRDKTGTNSGTPNNVGSQMVATAPLASRVSFAAEGRGLEPPTPYGAPDFESGCWPIRLPSGAIATNL
jgi:hypothetical protein